MLLSLPAEIILIIFDLLDDKDKLRLHSACRRLYEIPIALKRRYSVNKFCKMRNPNVIIQNIYVANNTDIIMLEQSPHCNKIKNIVLMDCIGTYSDSFAWFAKFVKSCEINITLNAVYTSDNFNQILAACDAITHIYINHHDARPIKHKNIITKLTGNLFSFDFDNYTDLTDLETLSVKCNTVNFSSIHMFERLTAIKFDGEFNQDLQALSMVPNLRKLTIGSRFLSKFNKNIDCLPDTIKELTIASRTFSQCIAQLPAELKKLVLNVSSVTFGKGALPILLQLDVMNVYAEHLYGEVIFNCLAVRENITYGRLPRTNKVVAKTGNVCKYYVINNRNTFIVKDNDIVVADVRSYDIRNTNAFARYISSQINLKLSIENLETLIIDNYCRDVNSVLDLSKLTNLKRFTININLNCKLIFPRSIVTITLGNAYEQPLDTWNCQELKKLEYLDIGHTGSGYTWSRFNHSLDLLYYCDSLKTLKLGNLFTHDIDMLPNSVQYLKLGSSFNSYTVWPDSLVELKIGKAFTWPLDNLPAAAVVIVEN